ncbi:MAG TPA: YaaL family protein [Bacillota bacterium]|nr:YaaL family protein [Bacillota bacterium]
MKNFLLAFFSGFETESGDGEQAELLNYVNQAKEDWHAAQNYFQNVCDPELVDYAIYKIEETKRKYMYLLKQAKEEGVMQDQVL